MLKIGEPTRTPYEQSKSAINRRFCYNMEKDSVKLIVKAHKIAPLYFLTGFEE